MLGGCIQQSVRRRCIQQPVTQNYRSPSAQIRIFWNKNYYSNKNVIFCSHCSPSGLPNYTLSFIFILIVSCPTRLALSSNLFPSGSPTKIRHARVISPMRVTCPAYPILLGLVILTMFGEEYQLRLCNLLYFLLLRFEKYKSVDRIHSANHRDECQAFVNTRMNLPVSHRSHFLIRPAAITFSSRTLLRRVYYIYIYIVCCYLP
jgi:hypothetical protein